MKTKQQGLSLIETMVSVVILSFGLIATTKMQLNMTLGNQLARQRVEAVNLAKSKIESFRGTGTCLATAPYTVTPHQGSAVFNVSVTCADTKTPTVLVTWNDAKGMQAKVADAAGALTADNRVQLVTSL